MNIRDLDGNLISWHITGNISKDTTTKKSTYHLKAREIIKRYFLQCKYWKRFLLMFVSQKYYI